MRNVAPFGDSSPKSLQLLQRAVAAHQSGNHSEAEALYRRCLDKDKRQFHALHFLGLLLAETGRAQEALTPLDRAIGIQPKSADLFANRGRVLNLLKRDEDALASYDKALAIDSRHAAALQNRAGTLLALGRYDEALCAFDDLLQLAPRDPGVLHNRGLALGGLGRHEEALANWNNILSTSPNDPDALCKRGLTLAALMRYEEAFADYQQALAIRPNFTEAWCACGNTFLNINNFNQALNAFDKAITGRPDLADAWRGRGNVLHTLKRFDEAFAAFDKAYAIDPTLRNLEGNRLDTKLNLCNWSNYHEDTTQLINNLDAGQPVIAPFFLLAIPATPAIQLRCAKLYSTLEFPQVITPLPPAGRNPGARIRLGYLSSDFREHPVAQVSARLFELHDRSRFELHAISIGAHDGSALRRRIESAFDSFTDLENRSGAEIAANIRQQGIDILVNLNGYTIGQRSEIFHFRPAPVSIAWLGFAGSLGMDCVDYLVADRTVIPADEQQYYAEKIVYLPQTFFPYDSTLTLPKHGPGRAEAGLPETGFVFCCFNLSYKINPPVFDIWMRLLNAVPGSVLWLSDTNQTAKANLRREAQARGVDHERLIFAPYVPTLAEHLGRQRHADLFLDTLPFNAHTTAANALWAGVPVLTCRGETFAGRVAASLLASAGVTDTVTESLQDYENLALKLASDPTALAEIRGKVAASRTSGRLFDMERFTHHLETAYDRMWERHQRGEAPAAIEIGA
jgi:predicted O-linked N-acetylglucosamine transferase (SPINDLY family)